MEHICAWRRPSEAAPEDGGLPSSLSGGQLPRLQLPTVSAPDDGNSGQPGRLAPERLVEIFQQSGRLDYLEKLEDGFRDEGGPCPLRSERDSPAVGLVALLVDRREDAALVEFLERAGKKLLRAGDAATRVVVASLLVSEALGRSGQHAACVQQRYERLVLERVDPQTGTVRLGDLTHEPASLGGSGRQPGAGAARHRAVLLKAMADWLGVAQCALCRNGDGCTWNTVLLDGDAFVVDVMFDPGALYEQNSGKAAEYLKRLRQEGEEAALTATAGRKRDSTPAPSMQQNLGGRMLRPSWHVEPWEVEFDRRDRAGRGGFGEVFQGTWAGQPVAVKEVRDGNPTDGDVCDFILEISMLSRLSHPNIIRFWRGCVDLRGAHRTLLLVTEWMDRGVLSTFLHENPEPSLSMGQMQVLAVGIGRGVAYLHHVKVLHLDLKSPNVLLNSSWQAKLCDFGLAKLRQQTALNTTLRGVSPIWAPPEMFDEKAGGVTEKADVYSFGIILFELATRKLPFSDLSQMQLPHAKVRGQLPCFPGGLDSDLVELTRLCLSYRPCARPPMHEALARMQQLASARGLDLDREQAEMERRGLHPGGGAASRGPGAEQVRRAEVERRRAEMEVARLKRQLREEEARLRGLSEAAGKAPRAGGSASAEAEHQRRLLEFCEARTQPVGDAKFRCAVCRKLFRGPEFVHKHLREKHLDEALDAFSPPPRVSGSGPPVRVETPTTGDVFFDADVAEESTARTYTDKLGRKAAGASGFSHALQDAAEAGDMSKLQHCLLQGGVSLNQADNDGTTPMHLSAKQDHVECLHYLISNQGSVNAANESGLTPLHLAAQQGHARACEALLEAGASVDASGGTKAQTPLHFAAAEGQRDVCALLLLHRACVNLQDEDGESALHGAARCGDRELCEAILSWGANVGAADRDGWLPLHEAARWGAGELVESLLQRGADPGARSNDGESALHVVPGGCAELEVVEVLVQWKCDINGGDYDGETPLHVAVRLGDAELAAVLLNSGADANAANATGATPLDFAKKDEIRWLLRSHRAKRGSTRGP